MTRGRTLTSSEKAAIEVVNRLQELHALPQRAYDFIEFSAITKKLQQVAGNGKLYKALDMERVVRLRWTSYWVIEVTVRLKRQVYGTQDPDKKDVLPWTPIGLEIIGPKVYWSSPFYGEKPEMAILKIDGFASVMAFLNLGRDSYVAANGVLYSIAKGAFVPGFR